MKALLQCGACRRPKCAHERMHNGVSVVCCDECATPFKLDRLVAAKTGTAVVCECSGCKARNARGRNG